MDAEKLRWCKRKGLVLREPNQNLARDYLESSEETLKEMRNVNSNSGSPP